jgi:hypothetical protein
MRSGRQVTSPISAAAIDKTLQRLAAASELRRIDRGHYDRPKNALTGRHTVPDYRAPVHYWDTDIR